MSATPKGPGIPDQRPGRPISAAWLNRVRDAAEGGTAAGPGLVSSKVAGRTIHRVTGTGARLVKTPVGGIPAASKVGDVITAGSADCTLYLPTSTGWTLGDVDVEVFNTITAAIAGSTDVQCKVIDGRLVVDVEPC